VYSAGTASLSIELSFRGIQREIRRESQVIAQQIQSAVKRGLKDGFNSGDPGKQGGEQGNRFGTSFAETVKKRISAAMRTLPEVKLDADASAVDRRIQEIRKELKDLSGKKVGIDIDEGQALAKLRELQQELNQIAKNSPSVRVAADTSAASAKLAEIQKDVDKIAKDNPNVHIGADAEPALRKIRETSLEADRLGAKRETVTIKADTKTASRNIHNLTQNVENNTLGMSRGARTVATYGSAIGLLGPIAGSGAVGLVNLAAAILPVSGLIAGLPAVVFGAAGALGTLKLAFSGVGDAIKAGFEGNSKKFNEAMKKLSPNARALVRTVVSLKGAFDGLKHTVQDRMFAGLSADFAHFAKSVIPPLRSGLGGIASGFNAIFRAALKAGATAKNISSMSVVLAAVHKVLQNASKAVGPFLTALGTVGRVIAPIIANLSNQLGGMANRFNSFIQAAAKSGQLADWFNTALEVLRQLGSVAKGVFGIVKGIFKAASPKGSSSALLTLVNTLRDAVNSLDGQNGLTAVFTAFKQVGTALAPVLRAAGAALVPLAKIFSDLVSGLAPGATTLLNNLKTAFENLEPAATPVANAVSAVVSALAPLLPEIGSILANGLLVLAGALKIVADALSPLTYLIGQVMGAFASMITGALIALINAILPQLSSSFTALKNAFTGMTPILAEIGQQFVSTFIQYMPKIAALFAQLIPVLAQVGQQLAVALLMALRQIEPFIPQIATSLALMAISLSQVLIELAPMLPTLIPLVAQFLIWSLRSGSLQSALVLLIYVLKILVSGVQTTITIVRAMISAWNAVNTFFGKTLPHAIGVLIGVLRDLWNMLWANVIVPVRDYFTKHIPQWTGTLVGKVKSLWQGLLDRITGIWHALYNNVIGPVKDFFTKKIPSWTGSLVGKVKSLWQGLLNRITGIWHALYNNVIAPIKDFFTKKIPSWTGLLVGKVKSLWQSLLNRIVGIWHSLYNNVVAPIKDFFTKKIPSWTGTLSGRVKSLWGSMVGRVKSLWTGLYNSVIRPIKDFFTKKIPSWSGTLAGAVKKNFGSLAGSVKKIWGDIKNFVKGPVKGILGMLHDMFHTVEVVADKFHIKAVKSAATSAAATMTSWRNKVNGWATGGAIHGPGSGTSDSIPAWLSNGEHVWTAKEVQAVGGQQNMLSLRKAALRGDVRPAYAKGGPVTHVGAAGFASGGNYVPNIITQIARKFQSGVRMTSGYRSNQTEGHADYHNAGLAADLVSGNMDALAAAFYKVPSYLLEEIHTRANSNTGWYVKNGKRVSNTFYGANVPLHRDHVHIAMSKASAESLLSKLTGKKGASLLDEIKAFAGSLAGGPVSTFDWATDFYDKYFKQYVDKIASFGKGDNNGIAGDLVSGVGKQVMDGTMDWVKDKFSSLIDTGGGDGSPYAKGIPTTGTLAGWIKKAMKLTGVYGKAGWYEKLYSIAMRESRGNPRAINNYDINAKNGIPSKGVMQIIPPQYKKHHQPGTSWNMYDPISNIAAAINYIKDVWKTPFNTPANYYASGTRSAKPGWSWVGENGPELVRFKGGEQVLPSGKSLATSNRYGGVNDAASAHAAAQLVAAAAPGAGGQFHVHANYTDMKPPQFKAAFDRWQVQQQLNTP
jgi:SLT domain-containing protein/phage-related protein